MTYYFRYTGDRNVRPINVSDKNTYSKTYHLQVKISNYEASQGHCSISLKMSPDIIYEGSNQKEGDTFNGGEGGHYINDPGPNPNPNPSRPEVPCTKCHGNKIITCTNCDGKGYKVVYVNSAIGGNSGESHEKCFKCHGNGTITCPRCNGSGKE